MSTQDTNADKWKLCNKLANLFRQLRGEELRPETDNPYRKKREENK